MKAGDVSFQRLFQRADEFCGLDRPTPLPQADTSAFDAPEDEEGGGHIKMGDPELGKLRSATRVVSVRKSGARGKPMVMQRRMGMDTDSVRGVIPDLSWDAEISKLMRPQDPGEDSDDPEAGAGAKGGARVSWEEEEAPEGYASLVQDVDAVSILRPQQPVTFEVAPFHCFYPDEDAGEEDPLDALFLNRQHEPIYEDMLCAQLRPQAAAEEVHGPVRVHTPFNLGAGAQTNLEAEEVVEDNSVPRSRSEREKRNKLEKAQRIKGVGIGIDTASSIERAANFRPTDNLPQYRSRATRSLIAALNHANIATAHENSKPDLYGCELFCFHRPMLFMVKEGRRPRWSIQLRAEGKKKKAVESDKQNLSLARSSAQFVMLEYVEELPPVSLNQGMASAMLNYYRAPGDKEEGGSRDREETKRAIDHVLASTTRSRLPRHVLLLLQLRNVKHTYEHDVNLPKLPEGETKVLGPEDDSPFLGTIEESEIQQSFTNNLFRAPIFKHVPAPTDFLLVRSWRASDKEEWSMTFVLREIPCIFVAGQLEPQRIVPRPVPKLTQVQETFLLLKAVTRLANSDWTFRDLNNCLLNYSKDETWAPHKAYMRQKIRTIVKLVAAEGEGGMWRLRNFKKELQDQDVAAEYERRFSPEELSRAFTPEDVCLQESCAAMEMRLYRQNITDVDLSKVEMWLQHTHEVKLRQTARLAEVRKIRTRDAALAASLEQLVSILQKKIRRLDGRLSVARYVFDRLKQAPWNTTEAYVRSYLERDGMGRMELQGRADPSGRGEGFSFVRVIKQARLGSEPKKKAVSGLYKTDKDLRKLTKKDAVKLLVAFGIRESEALALRRWDRVHMIREMSTKLEKTGHAKDLHKYARGGTTVETTAETSESFLKTANLIWKRQKQALSRTTPFSDAPASRGLASIPENAPATAALTEDDVTAATEEKSSGDGAEGERGEKGMDVEGEGETEKGEGEGGEGGEEEGKGADAEVGGGAEGAAMGAVGAVGGAVEGGGSSSDSDSDFAEDVARSMALRAQASARSEAAQKTAREAAKCRAEAEKREYSSMGSFFQTLGTEDAEAKRRRVSLEGASPPPSDRPNDDWPRPKHVVKRLTRVVRSDGTESVRVEFLFADQEVDRVERVAARGRKERESRRNSTRAPAAVGAGEEEVEEEGRRVAPVVRASATEPARQGGLTLNLGLMVKRVDKARSDQHALAEETGEDIYKGPAKSSRRTVDSAINQRVPRISLAVRLEADLMEVWAMKIALPFRDPVREGQADKYYEVVTQPMCLSDMREKVVTYQYEGAAQVVADMELMASNASRYNGAEHKFTKDAHKLLKALRDKLTHERKYLGDNKDPIALMEEAIQKKKVYLQGQARLLQARGL